MKGSESLIMVEIDVITRKFLAISPVQDKKLRRTGSSFRDGKVVDLEEFHICLTIL